MHRVIIRHKPLPPGARHTRAKRAGLTRRVRARWLSEDTAPHTKGDHQRTSVRRVWACGQRAEVPGPACEYEFTFGLVPAMRYRSQAVQLPAPRQARSGYLATRAAGVALLLARDNRRPPRARSPRGLLGPILPVPSEKARQPSLLRLLVSHRAQGSPPSRTGERYRHRRAAWLCTYRPCLNIRYTLTGCGSVQSRIIRTQSGSPGWPPIGMRVLLSSRRAPAGRLLGEPALSDAAHPPAGQIVA